ncbi:hypothetical protein EYF80_027337 [Liparis tanakae]|uniref:Uncharacterized protein n=1 Tax=Liparis tanakae TaxID=230148 RepID=A0A4Z2H9C9_9TELE|nr:hypothetical protein EYF80_027337 [Liparis tanakae]
MDGSKCATPGEPVTGEQLALRKLSVIVKMPLSKAPDAKPLQECDTRAGICVPCESGGGRSRGSCEADLHWQNNSSGDRWPSAADIGASCYSIAAEREINLRAEEGENKLDLERNV